MVTFLLELYDKSRKRSIVTGEYMLTRDSVSQLPKICADFTAGSSRLADWTTFRIGGEARAVLQVALPDDLRRVLHALDEASLPRVLLGGGSNILAADEAIDSVVVAYRSDIPPQPHLHDGLWQLDASAILDAAVAASIRAGYSGLEDLSGIPGTLGGAIVGNCGAFGRDMAQTVAWVEVLGSTGELRRIGAEQLAFSYRHSALKGQDLTVLRVGLRLAQSRGDHARQRRQEILDLRRSKHPDYTRQPTAGSYFKNIVNPVDGSRSAAGALLDACGARGMHQGGAAVFEKHANIIINTGGATAADVLALEQRLQRCVSQRFGVTLQREVRYLSKDGVFDAC